MRWKHWASMAVIAAMILAASIAYRIMKRQASPWVRAGVPQAAFDKTGLALTGINQLTNLGNAPTQRSTYAFYFLAVRSNDYEKDVASRIKFTDGHITQEPFQSIPPNQHRFISLSDQVVRKLSPVSTVGFPFVDPSKGDLYFRLLFTYYDSSGRVHHTNSCYQIEKGFGDTAHLFGCPFYNSAD